MLKTPRPTAAVLLLPLFLMVAALPGTSLAARSDAHARITAERAALTQRFDAEERACRERFVVTSCVEDVRVRRRQALAPLRQQELQLDDAERRERVAERAAAVAAKQRAAAERPIASQPAARVRQPIQPVRPPRGTAASGATQSSPAETARLRATQAAERVRAAELRRAEAAAAQARVAQRKAELDAKNKAKGRQPDPLPVPGIPPAP